MPKRINVAKLIRSEFTQTMVFSRIRKQYYDAPFSRKFSPCINSAIQQIGENEAMQSSIEANAHLIESVKVEINEQIKSLTKSIVEFESRIVRVEPMLADLISQFHSSFISEEIFNIMAFFLRMNYKLNGLHMV